MILLDTNVVSELLKPAPEPAVRAWLNSQDSAEVYLSAVSEAELRYGVALLAPGRRRERLAEAVETLVREEFWERVLPFDGAAARCFAQITAERRRAGRPISPFDGQIVAIARARRAVLASRNGRDFEGCDVAIINPWEGAL